MSEQAERHDLSELIEARHHRAEIVFGIISFAAALILLSQIGNQVTWVKNLRFVQQPGFWPVVAIVGMTIFGAFELYFTWRRNRTHGGGRVLSEVADWARALEYVVWFMAYVFAVPVTGYLPTTMVFCAALTWRIGYRDTRTVLLGVLTGVATVVVFKSLLGVRIPGGAVYEYLPPALRNFMILYF